MHQRRITYHEYGLSNANQIILAIIIMFLYTITCLRPYWIRFNDHTRAGLWVISYSYINGTNDTKLTSNSIPWDTFCTEDNYTLPIPNTTLQPISTRNAQYLCDEFHPSKNFLYFIRISMMITIILSAIAVTIALYLHVSQAKPRHIFYLGWIPGCSLIVAAILGTIVLVIWKRKFYQYEQGDSIGITMTTVAIAYIAGLSMLIRWIWPDICAVRNELQTQEIQRRLQLTSSTSIPRERLHASSFSTRHFTRSDPYEGVFTPRTHNS